MKFLCVPCDTPMTLQAIGPPDRGSLSVVYACPACGYEMAMLTNAYETQVVQSLGVRIGPAGAAAGQSGEGPAAAGGAQGSRCPFSAMIPGSAAGLAPPKPIGEDRQAPIGEGGPTPTGEGGTTIHWTASAEARLVNIPEFVRPMARTGIERFARERGAPEVDDRLLDAARDFFGM